MSLTGLPFLAVLAAAFVALLVVGVLRRGVHRLAALATAAVVALVGVAAGANRQFDYLTSWRDLFGVHSRDLVSMPQGHSLDQTLSGVAARPAVRATWARAPGWAASGLHGVVVRVRIPGPASGIARSAYVYLPPQYFSPAYSHARFPVVELFHGSPGVPADWLRLRVDLAEDRELSARRAGPLILVMPDDNGSEFRSSECVNADHGKQVETYLTRDVPRFVGERFRTTGRWGAAGYSTGGFCAVNLTLRNPGAYAAAVGVDGNYWAIQDRYTGHLYADRAQRDVNSPIWEVMHGAGRHQAFFLLTGRHDDSQWQTEELGAALGPRPFDVYVDQNHGEHSFRDWRLALGGELDWLWARLAAPDLARLFPVTGAYAPLGDGTWHVSAIPRHPPAGRRSAPAVG